MHVEQEQFGRYKLIRPLGAGGMGEVFLARDVELGRDVALKLLPPEKAGDEAARRRLLHEAQAAAQLDHPFICQVFEVGETPDGRAFIAMAFVDGETLAARLTRGTMSVHDALATARDIADALAAAHAHDLVHRDLKPQNIMVTPSGRPKLLDFGIAKLSDRSAAAAEASTDSGTAPGALIGTPAYMSPEHVDGRPLDGRSDLFSLGSVLFECLTGRRAFDGPTTAAVLGAIAHVHPPPVSSLRPDVPVGVDELCARLLAKAPAERLQSAEEVVGALRLLLEVTDHSRSTSPLPAPTGGRRRLVYLAAAVASVLVLAVGARSYFAARPLPTPTPEAERWYQRGTDFLREGAYHSAARSLAQAVAVFPDYVLAYAREAEALAELDDQTRAGAQLLRMQEVLRDESRLSPEARLRLSGIRAVVLRDLPSAISAYTALAGLIAKDAGVWVDLGRAQEAAEQRGAARESYTRALSLDPSNAGAHVRLASLDAAAGSRETALKSFAEAERLYRAAANVEGEAEVLLRRGMFLDARGELAAARTDLERALSMARDAQSTAQHIRARLALGSLAVTEGRLTIAEAMIGEATEDARTNELWGLVAEGLIETGAMLVNDARRRQEADQRTQEAERLATERGARRTAARATLQRAALAQQRNEPALAIGLAEGLLEYLRSQNYRRWEVTAQAIIGRAQRDMDNLTAARETAVALLADAESLDDDAQTVVALANLAGVQTSTGDLTAALATRTRAEDLNRKIGNEGGLPISLINRAKLLISLGRVGEARVLLSAVQDGMTRRVEAYLRWTTPLVYLQTLTAVVSNDTRQAELHARALSAEAPTDASLATLTRAVLEYTRATRPSRSTTMVEIAPLPGVPDDAREFHFWRAREAWVRHDAVRALEHVHAGLRLSEHVGNDELMWRLAAVGCLAASVRNDRPLASRMRTVSNAAWSRLRERWKSAMDVYETRPDLRSLRSELEQLQPS